MLLEVDIKFVLVNNIINEAEYLVKNYGDWGGCW